MSRDNICPGTICPGTKCPLTEDHSSARVNNHVPQVDRLEDELVSEQEKFKAITEELEQTFAEMSGY